MHSSRMCTTGSSSHWGGGLHQAPRWPSGVVASCYGLLVWWPSGLTFWCGAFWCGAFCYGLLAPRR